MVFKRLREDVAAILARDPAARSFLEVVLCYPGLHAIQFHRLSHWLWARGWHTLARFVSHVGRVLTGIEIHPGAVLGRRVFIDHGMGVVIGETAELGDDVTLYQGVTLGGTSWEKGKRHPTLGNDAIVGAGAQILGPLTVGEGARIGANAVVTKNVPAGVTMIGIPARVVQPRDRQRDEGEQQFAAYGISTADLPDPVARAVEGLLDRVSLLGQRVQHLEEEIERRGASVSASAIEDNEPVQDVGDSKV